MIMAHPLYSCKYIGLNLKLFHNLSRNRQMTLGKRINFSKCSDIESINKNSEQKNDKKKKEEEHGNREYPKEPTNCCVLGCYDCVWLEYVEKLNEYYKDGGERAMKDINEKITNENLKVFLLLELRMRNKQ